MIMDYLSIKASEDFLNWKEVEALEGAGKILESYKDKEIKQKSFIYYLSEILQAENKYSMMIEDSKRHFSSLDMLYRNKLINENTFNEAFEKINKTISDCHVSVALFTVKKNQLENIKSVLFPELEGKGIKSDKADYDEHE